MSERRISRQRRWQIKQREAGLCQICGTDTATRNVYCERCWDKRLDQQRKLRASTGLAIVTCILSPALAVIADAQPAPPAVRLRDVQTMTIAGDIYRSPTYVFVALRAPATPAYHVVQGFAPNVERTYWDGPDIRRHPRTGEFSETIVYLPVWSIAGGKLYVRGMRCLFPADCTPIRLDSLPLEVEP